MPFITRSNFHSIFRDVNYDIHPDYEKYYHREIFFFNKYEKSKLMKFRDFLLIPEKFIKQYYCPIKREDEFMFLYEGGTPAYHASHECPKLNSQYKNYKIPVEIKAKGKEKVIEFRNWLKSNIYLLNHPSTLDMRLHQKFGIIGKDLVLIQNDNSGYKKIQNFNLSELENEINGIINKSIDYYNNANEEKKDIIRRFQKFTFIGYSDKSIKENNTRFTDEALKSFLRSYDTHFKYPLRRLLREYYRVKHNPELKFEGFLLEQLGFKACKHCFK